MYLISVLFPLLRPEIKSIQVQRRRSAAGFTMMPYEIAILEKKEIFNFSLGKILI